MIAIEFDDFVKVFWKNKKILSINLFVYCTASTQKHRFWIPFPSLVADIANEVGSKMHFKRGRWLHGDDDAAAVDIGIFQMNFSHPIKKCNNAWEQNVLDIIHCWKKYKLIPSVEFLELLEIGSFMWRVEDKQSWSRSCTDDEKHLKKGWKLCFSMKLVF